jgi:hypothetical protein
MYACFAFGEHSLCLRGVSMLLESALILGPELLFEMRGSLPATGDDKSRYDDDGQHNDDGYNNFGIHRPLSLQSLFDAGRGAARGMRTKRFAHNLAPSPAKRLLGKGVRRPAAGIRQPACRITAKGFSFCFR